MKKRNAFTLVELLIMIAIISVLAALLLPALGQAVTVARQVECVNRQKQFGLGIAMYQHDYTWYPPAEIQGGYSYNAPWTGSYYIFPELVSPYLSIPYVNFIGLSVSGNPFLCPASGYTPQTTWAGVTATAYFVAGRAYVANYALSAYFGFNHCFNTSPAYNHDFNHICRPKRNPPEKTPASRRILLGECRGSMGGMPSFGFMEKHSAVIYPHGGMTNILFLDGHAAAFPPISTVYRTELEFYSNAELQLY